MSVIGHGYEICTSTTRPSTAAEGLTIYETDTNKVRTNLSSTSTPNWVEVHDLDSNSALPESSHLTRFFNTDWTSFTPTWQNINNPTTNEGWYLRIGSLYWVNARFICSSTTSVSGTIRMNLPNSAQWSMNYPGAGAFFLASKRFPIGQATFYDSSLTRLLSGLVVPDHDSSFPQRVEFLVDYYYTSPTRIDVINNGNPWTWANLDEINISFMFSSNSAT